MVCVGFFSLRCSSNRPPWLFAHGASLSVPRTRPQHFSDCCRDQAWGKHACHSAGLQPLQRWEQGIGIVVSAPVLRKLLRIAHIKVRRGFVVFQIFVFFSFSPWCLFYRQAFCKWKKKKISVPLILPSLLSPFRLVLPKVIIFNENSQP